MLSKNLNSTLMLPSSKLILISNLSCHSRAHRLDSTFPDAAFGYAKYREMRSNFSQALEYVNRILATRSDYLPAVLENMKLQLCMQDWEQCEEVAQR